MDRGRARAGRSAEPGAPVRRTAAVWARWLLVLAAVAVGLGAVAALYRPRGVEDSRGVSVTLGQVPERIVSAAPAVTEILFAVGAAGQVVGVDDWSNYPPEAEQVPSIGGYYPLNIESILALRPDLIVAMGEQAEWTAQLEQVGVKVFLIDPRTLEEVRSTIISIGRITGHRREAERLADSIRERIAAVRRKVATIPESERLRVFYEVYSDPLMTVGPQTLIGQLLVTAGGLSISAGVTQDYPVISAEEVIDCDPQAIVFPDVHGTESEGAVAIRSRPGWASVAAVREGRIWPVDPDIFSRPGPRVADAVEILARLLYPEVFR